MITKTEVLKHVKSDEFSPNQIRLIPIATKEFLAKGIVRVRMEDLSRIARMSKKTIYNEFTSKDQLILVCIHNFFDGLYFDSIAAFEVTCSKKEKWEVLIKLYYINSLRISSECYQDLLGHDKYLKAFKTSRAKFINFIINKIHKERSDTLKVLMFAYVNSIFSILSGSLNEASKNKFEKVIVPFYALGLTYIEEHGDL